jgi:hypothetical protein
MPAPSPRPWEVEPYGSSICGRWRKRHEPRREGERGMRTYGALVLAVLLIGALLTSCAATASTSQHAPARVFDERGRNPVLTTP